MKARWIFIQLVLWVIAETFAFSLKLHARPAMPENPEKIYEELLKDPSFRQADRDLTAAYARVRAALEENARDALRARQMEWIRARNSVLLRTPRQSRAEAATRETQIRTLELQSLLNSTHPKASEASGKSDLLILINQNKTLAEASTLMKEAGALLNRGAYEEAELFYIRALEIRERALGPHADTCSSVNALAHLYCLNGTHAKAEPLYLRAIEIVEKTLGPRHPVIASALNNLAKLYSDTGANLKAEPLYLRAIDIVEKTLGSQDLTLSHLLNDLGMLYRDTGAYSKAGPLVLRALEIREKLLGPQHPITSDSLNGLAIIYGDTGAYSKAEALYLRALEIREKSFAPQHPKISTSIHNLAGLYNDTGAYSKAEPLYLRALELKEKALGAQHPDIAYVLNDLAEVYCNTGDYSNAEILYLRAIEIREKALGSQHPDIASSLNNLASFYRRTGSDAKAEPLLIRALDIAETALGPEHLSTGRVIHGLAAFYRDQDAHTKSEAMYTRALEIKEKTLGPNHPDTGATLRGLARLCKKIGADTRARAHGLRAVGILEQELQDVLQLEESRRLSWQEKSLNFDLPAAVLKPDQLAQCVLRWKGIVLDSVVEDRAAMRLLDRAEYEDSKSELQGLRQRLWMAVQKGQAEHQEKEAIEGKIRDIEKRFAAQSVALGQTRANATLFLEQVAACLPRDGVIVDFIQFTPLEEHQGGQRYGAVITGQSGDSRWLDLGEVRALETAVSEYRKALLSGDENSFAASAKTLHETIWKPVEAVFASEIQTVFVCPDGVLNFVPFAALSATGQSFVGERYRIAYLGSARDLMREPGRAARVKMFSIFANPDFVGQGARAKWEPLHEMRAALLADFGKLRLSPLPGTESEGNSIALLAKSAGWEADLKLGAAATEKALVGLKSPAILHVATHGFFLGEESGGEPGSDTVRGMQLKPFFDGEPAEKASSVKRLEQMWSPMRRSCLALAGAQRTFEAWGRGQALEPASDGVLSAEETAFLDLTGTWMVTLSACETGLGKPQSGEGVFGLRRAVMMAGASNLLVTLWPVRDDTTGQIMADFYAKAIATGKGWETLAEVQRDWLVKLRNERGMLIAVRDAGPFAMAVMVNPAKAGF